MRALRASVQLSEFSGRPRPSCAFGKCPIRSVSGSNFFAFSGELLDLGSIAKHGLREAFSIVITITIAITINEPRTENREPRTFVV